MRTVFSPEQLAKPGIQIADDILRKCVHCGFCTATCPTYVLLGDELDSPRGRIYLIKNMLEKGTSPSAKVVTHIDRCLSCLSCKTTCPSGVDYMHLVDSARVHIQETYQRLLVERLFRWGLALVLPRANLFRLSLIMSSMARPFAGVLPNRLRSLLALAPKSVPAPSDVDRPQVFKAEGERKKRVVLMMGCAQKALRPIINEATVRLLTRHGCEVIIAQGEICCGALVHHMGQEDEALNNARKNIDSWLSAAGPDGLDAVVINASGCGTMVKDYGYLLKDDPNWSERASGISALTRDVTEVLGELELEKRIADTLPSVAYHSACSLQHGQGIHEAPKELLESIGFPVRLPAEGHLCCGSAGTYNILQQMLANKLRDRKTNHLEATGCDVIAAGNIGCIIQLESGSNLPVFHTVELLDWATGGPKPTGLD
ncbi:MAG: glycolate oxidase subunit GlcF [Rhodospirillales bacterium]|nr:glycolate oxidase subunit GlcF [Rhodospirillales bacterium]